MKITIITACYNSIATIRDAIESVKSQRLPSGVELEHLIIDGGSSDGTVELLKEYEDIGVGDRCRCRMEDFVVEVESRSRTKEEKFHSSTSTFNFNSLPHSRIRNGVNDNQ